MKHIVDELYRDENELAGPAIERQAMERVRKECPEVEWVKSYAILRPCDYLGIVWRQRV